MVAVLTEVAAVDITPIRCFSAYDCDVGAGLAVQVALLATLVAGALIMRRWRDMLLVAAVAWAAVFILEIGREYVRHDFLPPLGDPLLWREMAFGYAVCLVCALVFHAIKRGVVWLAVQLQAPQDDGVP